MGLTVLQKFSTGYNILTSALKEMEMPFILAIQWEGEKGSDEDPLVFELPGHPKPEMVIASCILKNGFKETMNVLMPGLNLDKTTPEDMFRRLAEWGQGDGKQPEEREISIPLSYDNFTGNYRKPKI